MAPALDDIDLHRIYGDGMSLFAGFGSSPINHTDPSGLFIGLLAPMSTMDIYTDYNEEAINGGMSMGDMLSQMMRDYAEGQDLGADFASDWDMSDRVVGTFGVGGVAAAVKLNQHHIIPRFLLGLNRAANRLGLPQHLHGDYHRMLEQEFTRAGLNAVSSRGDDRWVSRLMEPGEVGEDEIRKIRAALLRSGRRFDDVTNGKYDLARKIRTKLDDAVISPKLRIRRRRQ